MTTEAERLVTRLKSYSLSSGYAWHCHKAADLIEQQAAEIARLHDYDTRLSAVMPSDYKDWHEGSKREWPELAAESIKMWRDRANEAYVEIERLNADAGEKLKELNDYAAQVGSLKAELGRVKSWH